MKKKLALSALALGLSSVVLLSSCSGTTRNSQAPTGSLDLTSIVATASSKDANGENPVEYKMSNSIYYNRLRYSASDLVQTQIKKGLYLKEYNAVCQLWNNQTLSNEVSSVTRDLLTPTKNNTKLFELTGTELDGTKTNYEYLYNMLTKYVNDNLVSSIYGTTSYKTIKALTDKELATKLQTYITNQAKVGITVNSADLAYTGNEDTDRVTLNTLHSSSNSLSKAIDNALITYAEKLNSRNALYQIADEEYIKEYDAEDDDEETKNGNYLYDTDNKNFETKYNSTYKTYGTYHGIIISFNSRKEALDSMAKLGITFSESDDAATKASKYLALYNYYYSYRGVTKTDINDKDFTYVVNKDQNEINSLSSTAQTVLTTVLEDGDCLTEPRNIENKYVMAYRYDTSYTFHKSGDETKELDFDDFKKVEGETNYNNLITKLKFDLLTDNEDTYVYTNTSANVYKRTNSETKTDDIYINDPLFEQNFASTYTDFEFNDKQYFDNSVIVKIDDFTYTVEDFYKDASDKYASTIITDFFQLEYAYQFYDEYVKIEVISDEDHSNNTDTLNNAISEFNYNNNSTYEKAIGLENFLLATYGYSTKEDVLKYYYDASNALTVYKAKMVYTEWVTMDDNGAYQLNDKYVTTGLLANILADGNTKYDTIMSINLDHILINIDDDGDGSADDPDKFTADMTAAEKEEFENAVVKLARIIYAVANSKSFQNSDTTKLYKDTLVNILKYIKTQYEEGNDLLEAVTVDGVTYTSWKQVKDAVKFNFLLTVEQLSSSSNITQDTVTNYVKPFQEYVKGIYKTAVANSETTSYTNGRFYVYNTEDKTGKIATNADDISINTLCKTSFGYHTLIFNSYSKPSSLEYDSSDDTSSTQSAIQLLLYKNSDDSKKNIYMTTNSYNDPKSEVAREKGTTSSSSFNQFLVYYVQKSNGDTSSLDSTISSTMSTLFDNYISMYASANFQALLLIDHLNIEVKDVIANKTAVTAQRDYLAKVITNYATTPEDSDYYYWVYSDSNKTKLDFTRPDSK